MELPLPDTVEGAVRWLLGGVLIFAFGFESVVMLWEGKFVLSASSLMIAITLTLLLVYWAYLPTIVLVAAFILGLASIPLVFYGILRFVRARRIPRPMLLITATFLLLVALIAAIAGGALFYVARTTKPGSVEEAAPKTVIVHEPPSAEQIAKAAGEALRTVTAQRDLLKQDNDTLRKIVPQPPPPPVLPNTFPDDVKARLRPQVDDLAKIFDLNGFPVWRLTKKLLDEVGDFQNPEGDLPRNPDALISMLSELRKKAQAFSDDVFKEFMPNHQYDKSELSALVGDDKALYAFTQATSSLEGDLHSVLTLEEKSTDKNFTKNYAMPLLLEKYKLFSASAANLKKWFDDCNQRFQQEKQALQ
jgi:hypothetical protein